MNAIKKQFDETTDDKEKAELFEKMIKLLDEQKAKRKAYRQTEQGKAALKRANAKYWAKKRTGNPVGRPKKDKSNL